MRVLIGCECSGIVRQAFRNLGHEAWSCDLKPAEDGSWYHHRDDLLDVIKDGNWDLGIFHPPCTYLSSSGLHWNNRVPGRRAKTKASLRFVCELMVAPIKRIAIENPIGCISTQIRPFDQKIQPYEFGDDASKGTCLWLKNLPLLTKNESDYVKPRMVCECGRTHSYEEEFKHGCPDCGPGKAKPRWANQTDSGQNKLGPSDTRAQDRARTYPGIARAMAAQWGSVI